MLILYSSCLENSTRAGEVEKVSLLLDTMSTMLIEIFVLCICTTLNVYPERTKPWRTDQKKQLLPSYVNPHKEVCSSTNSGWIIKVLDLAGIDTSVFKGHSSRSVA